MKILFAHIVSLLFHPVLFFFLMPFFIVYKDTSSELYALKWVTFSSLFLMAGLVFFFFGRIKGIFSDFDLTKREEREKFYVILGLLAAFYLAIALYFKGILFPLSIVAFGIMLGIGVFAIANFFLKASIHVAVACAYAITIGLLYGLIAFALTIVIVPLVAWSRLVLHRHVLPEIIVGGILGIFVTIMTFVLGKYVLGY